MSEERAALQPTLTNTALEKQWSSLKSATARAVATRVSFAPERYSESAINRLTSLWRMRLDSEFRSASAFALLAPQLMAARAPIDVISAVLSGAQDELRHTEYCGQVLRALGATPAVNSLVEPPTQPLHRGVAALSRALRNVVFGSCVSEVVNAARFGDAFEVITDDFLKEMTRLILADEIAHGQLGFHYLASLRGQLEAQPELREDLVGYLTIAFKQYEFDVMQSLALAPPPTEEERRLGLTDPDRERLIFTMTIEQAIIPGLMAHGIDAERAWSARSRAR